MCRRAGLLLLILAALAFGSSAAQPVAVSAEPVEARSAEALVDSIGVNVHLGYSDSVYDNFPRVRAALERLGVHHIRDGLALGRPDTYQRFHELAAEGIKLDAIVGDPLQRFGSGPLRQQLRLVARRLGPRVVASLEGPNEFDNQGIDNWKPILLDYQARLWRGVQARASIASIPVLGPSLVNYEARGELGDISGSTTEGNMHPYPGGEVPDDDEHSESELSLAAENTGDQSVQATETGYTNAVNADSGQGPATESAAATYMPRLFLDNFRRGITRSYVYELIDEGTAAAHDDTEDEFGLLRHDYSPKPAYVATKNLISILEDEGGPFTPGSLDYSLSGADEDTRQLLLEKRDGSFYLALWNADSVWDPDSREEEDPGETTVTLEFGEPVSSATSFRPNRSDSPVSSINDPVSLQLSLSSRVTLIEIDPGGATRARTAGLPGSWSKPIF